MNMGLGSLFKRGKKEKKDEELERIKEEIRRLKEEQAQ